MIINRKRFERHFANLYSRYIRDGNRPIVENKNHIYINTNKRSISRIFLSSIDPLSRRYPARTARNCKPVASTEALKPSEARDRARQSLRGILRSLDRGEEDNGTVAKREVLRQDIALLKLNNSRAAERNPDARRIGTKCLHARYRPPPLPQRRTTTFRHVLSPFLSSLFPSFQSLLRVPLLIPSFLPPSASFVASFLLRERKRSRRKVRERRREYRTTLLCIY